MPLAPGTPVVVIALKRRGQIIAREGTRYRVAVGGLTISCREHEVRDDSQASGKQRRARRTPSTVSVPGEAAAGARRQRSSIDLHGMTVVQSREALVAHIDAALRAGDDLVEVVHGIGTGRVRATVLDLLRQIPSVRRVQPHPTNNGVTLVHL